MEAQATARKQLTPPKTVLGIDPGPDKSAFVVLDWANMAVLAFGHEDNDRLLAIIETTAVDDMAVENVSYYGPHANIGATTIDTARWVGRFQDRRITGGKIPNDGGIPNVALIKNQTVRVCLCGNVAVKKNNVHQAVKDRFPRTGGGACPQKGTKKEPGPLYGMSGNHIWDALAIAITFTIQEQQR